MSYRNLWEWIDNPFGVLPDNAKEEQTKLPFPDLDSIMEKNRKKAQKNSET